MKVHKFDHTEVFAGLALPIPICRGKPAYCNMRWANVTCKRCLANKPTQRQEKKRV